MKKPAHGLGALVAVTLLSVFLAASPWPTALVNAQTVIGTVPVGGAPFGVEVNATTNRVYVTNQNNNAVSVIDGATNAVLTTVAVGNFPVGAAANPTTNRVYV